MNSEFHQSPVVAELTPPLEIMQSFPEADTTNMDLFEAAFTPIIETVPGTTDMSRFEQSISDTTEMPAAFDPAEFMAKQAQVNQILFQMLLRTERGSQLSTNLSNLLVGGMVVNSVVRQTYFNEGGAIAEAQRRVDESLTDDTDEKED